MTYLFVITQQYRKRGSDDEWEATLPSVIMSTPAGVDAYITTMNENDRTLGGLLTASKGIEYRWRIRECTVVGESFRPST